LNIPDIMNTRQMGIVLKMRRTTNQGNKTLIHPSQSKYHQVNFTWSTEHSNRISYQSIVQYQAITE
jgi:hypothetical protein